MKNKNEHFIHVTLREYDQMMSNYNDKSLSQELGQYIYKECQGIPMKKRINIKVTSKFLMTEDYKKKLSDLIHAYFGLEVKENLIFIKYNMIKNVFFSILGIVILTIAFTLQKHFYNVISEILIIIGWILLWEVLYNLFFNNRKLRIKIKRDKMLARCKIQYEN